MNAPTPQPKPSRAHKWGSRLRIIGLFKRAEPKLRDAITAAQLRHDPSAEADAWHQLGICLAGDESRTAEALECFDKAGELYGDNARKAAQLERDRSRAHLTAGNFAKAGEFADSSYFQYLELADRSTGKERSQLVCELTMSLAFRDRVTFMRGVGVLQLMALSTFMDANAVFRELGHRQYEQYNLRWLIKATRALGAHGMHGRIARYRMRYTYLIARNTVATLLH